MFHIRSRPVRGATEINRPDAWSTLAGIFADVALAGIRSLIPPDEVLDALLDVEQRLPPELKCATIGDLACIHTAKCVWVRLARDCESCKA